MQDFILQLALQPKSRARLLACVELTLTIFHPSLFAVPGLLTSQTDARLKQRVRRDSVQILAHLSKPSLAGGGEEEDGHTALAQFGNLLSAHFALDEDDAAAAMVWDVVHSFLQTKLPAHALHGRDGVGWSKNRVCVVPPVVFQQFDVHLPNLIQRMCQAKRLQVDPVMDARRVQRDLAEWDAIVSATPRMSTTADATTGKSSYIQLSRFSSWAKRLMGKGEVEVENAGPLRNVSEESRAQATSAATLFLSPPTWTTFSKLLAELFLRWPPSVSNPISFAALNASAFTNPNLIERWWVFLEDYAYDARAREGPIREDLFWSGSLAFCIVASHVLLITDESELQLGGGAGLLNRCALERCVRKLNAALYELPVPTPSQSEFAVQYVKRCVRFLTLVRDMHARRALCRESAWTPSPAAAAAPGTSSLFQRFKQAVRFGMGGAEEVLDEQERVRFVEYRMFWSIPFERKARLFVQELALERAIQQPADEPPAHRLKVRRREAGLREAMPFFLRCANLRQRVFVVFENDFGALEAGIDARGLFKEFIQTLAEAVFAPGGLFAMTSDGDQSLFPNPKRAGELASFTFAGKLLGKALFEGIIIQPEFSLFILAKLLGKLVSIGDLASLDAELFKNLLFLKTTKMDVAELDLYFTVAQSLDGKEVELFPGGAAVRVTSLNKYRYVNAMAHYKLNVENKDAQDAFIAGFYSVIRADWIEHFSERELQMLISGQGALDVADWKANTVYSAGYFPVSPMVQWFWEIVEREMTGKERELLLRFATACSRAPLLGFASLEPKFHIQRVALDAQSPSLPPLPTSSTCFNTLKLPNYASKQVLKEKLLVAIKSGAGFELS